MIKFIDEKSEKQWNSKTFENNHHTFKSLIEQVAITENVQIRIFGPTYTYWCKSCRVMINNKEFEFMLQAIIRGLCMNKVNSGDKIWLCDQYHKYDQLFKDCPRFDAYMRFISMDDSNFKVLLIGNNFFRNK